MVKLPLKNALYDPSRSAALNLNSSSNLSDLNFYRNFHFHSFITSTFCFKIINIFPYFFISFLNNSLHTENQIKNLIEIRHKKWGFCPFVVVRIIFFNIIVSFLYSHSIQFLSLINHFIILYQLMQQQKSLKSYKGLTFKKLYSETQCTQIINDMAQKIYHFYKTLENQQPDHQQVEVVAICLLKGAFMFYTDLIRKIPIKILCEFVKISSYAGQQSTGQIKIEGGFDTEKLKGRHVLLIQDMADTGLTLSMFKTIVEKSQPASLKTAVLVNRPDKPKNFTIDWIGLQCSDFIIGYGLDYDQFGRTFPAIYQKV